MPEIQYRGGGYKPGEAAIAAPLPPDPFSFDEISDLPNPMAVAPEREAPILKTAPDRPWGDNVVEWFRGVGQSMGVMSNPAQESAKAVQAMVDAETYNQSNPGKPVMPYSTALKFSKELNDGIKINPQAAQLQSSIGQRLEQTWKVGRENARANQLAAMWSTSGDQRYLDAMYEIEKALPTEEQTFIPESELEKAFHSAAKFATSWVDPMAEGAKQGMGVSMAFAASAALAGGEIPAIGALTIPAAAASGFTVGMTSGMLRGAQMMEAGSSIREMLKYKDAKGNTLDPTYVKVAGNVYGAIAMIPEYIQMKTLIKSIPGGEKLLRSIVSDTLTSKTFLDKMVKVAGAYGMNVMSNTGEEVIQQGMQHGVQELTKVASNKLKGTELAPATQDEIIASLKDTFVEALRGSAVLMAPGAGLNMAMPSKSQQFVPALPKDIERVNLAVQDKGGQILGISDDGKAIVQTKTGDIVSIDATPAYESDQGIPVLKQSEMAKLEPVQQQSVSAEDQAVEALLASPMEEVHIQQFVDQLAPAEQAPIDTTTTEPLAVQNITRAYETGDHSTALVELVKIGQGIWAQGNTDFMAFRDALQATIGETAWEQVKPDALNAWGMVARMNNARIDDVQAAITRVQAIAEKLGVKIDKIDFVDEENIINHATPEGRQILTAWGMSDKEIQDAIDRGDTFRIAGEHRLSPVDGSAAGQRGSTITLWSGHSSADVYHEFGHAVQEQRGIRGFNRETVAQQEAAAKHVEGLFAAGKEDALLDQVAEYTPEGDDIAQDATRNGQILPLTEYSIHTVAPWEQALNEWMDNANLPKAKQRKVKANILEARKLADILSAHKDLFPHNEDWNTPGQKFGLGSPIRPNSDEILYIKSLDLSAMCVKRLEYGENVIELMRVMGDTPTVDNLLLMAIRMREAGKDAPCIYCYVEAPRTKSVEMLAGPMEELKATFGKEKGKVHVDPEYFADPDAKSRIDADPRHPRNNKLKEIYDTLLTKQRGAKANVLKTYVDYAGQMISLSEKSARQAAEKASVNNVEDIPFVQWVNNRAGMRIFSVSDFQIEHVFDLLQATIDMFAVGMKSHAYTKVADFARIFGATGMKIQTSVFAVAQEDGTFKEDDKMGMAWKDAQELRKQHKNVGTIMVTTSDAMTWWAMEQDWIDYIIPFHASGMEARFFRDALNWKNYTGVQSEKWINPAAHVGEKLVKTTMADILGGKSMTTEEYSKAYLALAKKRGIVPVFEQFSKMPDGTINPNYGKLRKDYARTDSAFEVADPSKIDISMARALLDEYIANGGRNVKADKAFVQKIVDEIVAGQTGEDALRKSELRNQLPMAQMSIRAVTQTPEFKAWFGDSKVVDEAGKPLVVYHGTGDSGFAEFSTPAYFTEEPSFAEMFADGEREGIYPVYLKISNPYMIDARESGRHFEWSKREVSRMKREGYDGVIVKGGEDESDIYTVFDPTQIKSATGNRGTFDPNDKNINRSIRVEDARRINIPVVIPTNKDFLAAVENTPGASVTADGVIIDVSRYQKPEQEGEESVRTGVFYLPELNPSNRSQYTRASNTYGGRQVIQGQTLYKNPIVVKAGTGGRAPELAYDQIKGKGAYQKMRVDVLQKAVAGWGKKVSIEDIKGVLRDHGGDAGQGYNIYQFSKVGNLLAYAIQENIVANAIRDDGHDGMLAYSKRRDGTFFLSEVFDVREDTYPGPNGEYTLHPAFELLPDETVMEGVPPTEGAPDAPVNYSVRVEPPKKTIKAYKLFRTLKNRPGEIFPLFIGKDVATPVGEWIQAEYRPTPGFAQRPGWHVGTLPMADHLMKKDGTMQSGRVWAEVEIPADVNWQEIANQQPTKDIQGMTPEGGYYRFKRPANQGGEWMIAGSIKVNRILDESDVKSILGESRFSIRIKSAIHQATGLTKVSDVVRTDVAFREVLRKSAQAAQTAYKAGLKEGTEAEKANAAEKLAQAKQDMKDLLAQRKERDAARAEAQGIINDINKVRRALKSLQPEAQSAIKPLLDSIDFQAMSSDKRITYETLQNIYSANPQFTPSEDTVAKMERLSKTPIRDLTIDDLAGIRDMVREAEALSQAKEAERTQAMKDISKIADKTGNIAVDYKKQINALLAQFDFKKPTEQKMQELRSLKAFLDSNGVPLGISGKYLAELERLGKTPLKDLSTADLVSLANTLKHLQALGRLKADLKYKYHERERQKALTALIADTHNIDPSVADLADKTGREKLRIGLKSAYVQTLHTTRVADMLDGFANYKKNNARLIKELGEAETLATWTAVQKKIAFLAELRDMGVQEITPEMEVRMMVVMRQREGARSAAAKLIDHYKLSGIPTLTAQEEAIVGTIKKYINAQKDVLAATWEEINQDIFPEIETYYLPLKYEKEEQLIPDSTVMGGYRTTHTFDGFSNARKQGVKKLPRVDLITIFSEALDEQLWFMHLQPKINDIGQLVLTEEYGEAAGEMAQSFWRDHLDIMARRGWSNSAKSSAIATALGTIRHNLNRSVLLFKLSTSIMQPFAVFDAMAYMNSKYGPIAAARVLGEVTKNFLVPGAAKRYIETSKELQMRKGGELALEEELATAQGASIMDKATRIGFSLISRADVNTAAGVQQAVERIMTEQGVADPKTEAEFIMNLVSGNSSTNQRPHILASGEAARTWFTFGTFIMNRWGMIVHDLVMSGIIKSEGVGIKLLTLASLGILMLAGNAEDEARKIITELTLQRKMKEKKHGMFFWGLMNLLSTMPVLGNFINAAQMGVSPVPPVMRVGEEMVKRSLELASDKDPSAKAKAAMKAAEAGLTITYGIPGTAQAFDILEGAMFKK